MTVHRRRFNCGNAFKRGLLATLARRTVGYKHHWYPDSDRAAIGTVYGVTFLVWTGKSWTLDTWSKA
jgi:hypothetical protein